MNFQFEYFSHFLISIHLHIYFILKIINWYCAYIGKYCEDWYWTWLSDFKIICYGSLEGETEVFKNSFILWLCKVKKLFYTNIMLNIHYLCFDEEFCSHRSSDILFVHIYKCFDKKNNMIDFIKMLLKIISAVKYFKKKKNHDVKCLQKNI